MYGESSTQAMATFLAAVRDDDREAVERAWDVLEYWLFIMRTGLPDLCDPAVLAAMAPSPDSRCPECQGFLGRVPAASRCACPPAISNSVDPQATDLLEQDINARRKFRMRNGGD